MYELEQIIHSAPKKSVWQSIEVIIDSPMAANFTEFYLEFKELWDAEAKRRVKQGRHPLDFSSVVTTGDHKEHVAVVNYLRTRNQPAIVIAAGGMCNGGRIVNYLEAFLPDSTADVLFVGHQAKGTLGRDIQKYGSRGGYVFINNQRVNIKAAIHSISGYSAHADQADLTRFATKMKSPPSVIKLVHGEEYAKQALRNKLAPLLPNTEIQIPE